MLLRLLSHCLAPPYTFLLEAACVHVYNQQGERLDTLAFECKRTDDAAWLDAIRGVLRASPYRGRCAVVVSEARGLTKAFLTEDEGDGTPQAVRAMLSEFSDLKNLCWCIVRQPYEWNVIVYKQLLLEKLDCDFAHIGLEIVALWPQKAVRLLGKTDSMGTDRFIVPLAARLELRPQCNFKRWPALFLSLFKSYCCAAISIVFGTIGLFLLGQVVALSWDHVYLKNQIEFYSSALKACDRAQKADRTQQHILAEKSKGLGNLMRYLAPWDSLSSHKAWIESLEVKDHGRYCTIKGYQLETGADLYPIFVRFPHLIDLRDWNTKSIQAGMRMFSCTLVYAL